jgi:N-acyl-D-aspartate/D-glutamate deacylase
MQLRQPWIKFGIDGPGVDPAKMQGVMMHPRVYGTFPRVLGLYVRDQKVLSLEDAIRKMTSTATRRLSIRERGILQEGCFADIAIFNPDTVIDHAVYKDVLEAGRELVRIIKGMSRWSVRVRLRARRPVQRCADRATSSDDERPRGFY